MEYLIAIVMGVFFAFGGGGWEMPSNRRLLFRSLTLESALVAIFLFLWKMEWSHQVRIVGIFILIAACIPLFFFAYKHLKSKVLLVWNVIAHMKEANELLTLKGAQLQNPKYWLYPVIETIDLNNRQGAVYNGNAVYVKFQINSHLLFPINEFYVFVKLCLAVPPLEQASNWYEIMKPEHYAPWGRLEYEFFEYVVHLVGETNEERTLLEWIQDFRRSNKRLLTTLQIGIKFKKDDTPIVLEGKGAPYIALYHNL